MRPFSKPKVIFATLIVVGLSMWVVMLSYRHKDPTVTPKIEGKQELTMSYPKKLGSELQRVLR